MAVSSFANFAVWLAVLLELRGTSAQASAPVPALPVLPVPTAPAAACPACTCPSAPAPAPGPRVPAAPAMRPEDLNAMYAIRNKLPSFLQNGLTGDDPCTWTIFNSTCPLIECRLYNINRTGNQVYVTKFVLDLPYDLLNASTYSSYSSYYDEPEIRDGPTFYSTSSYSYLNPATSYYTGVDVPSESGAFISHRPNRSTYHTPDYCRTSSGRRPTGESSYSSSYDYPTDISNWQDQVDFEVPLELLSNLSRLDTVYIPGPTNRSVYQGVRGSLPAQWATSLPLLTTVVLANNSLNGTLPPEWGNPGALRRLQLLQLQNNMLSGPIPVEWGQPGAFANLRYLDMSSNDLSGPIPSFGASPGNENATSSNTSFFNLTALFLKNNSLSGPWQSSLENLRNVTELDLSNNQLTGTLPASIFSPPAFGSLYHLFLANNSFSGSLPDAAPNALSRWPISGRSVYSSDYVISPLILDVSGNQLLSGVIPESWSSAGNNTIYQELVIFGEDTALCGVAPLNVSPLALNTTSLLRLTSLYEHLHSQGLTTSPRVSRARFPACT